MSESRGFPAELLSFALFGQPSDTAAEQHRQNAESHERIADTCHNSRVHGQPAVCTGSSFP